MPANTPHGLPYPLPSEPVAEGAQAIRDLAEALDITRLFYLRLAVSADYATTGAWASIPGANFTLPEAGTYFFVVTCTVDVRTAVAGFNFQGQVLVGASVHAHSSFYSDLGAVGKRTITQTFIATVAAGTACYLQASKNTTGGVAVVLANLSALTAIRIAP
jgi:hypothetical protein